MTPGPRAARVVFIHGGFFGAWCWDALIASCANRHIRAEAVEMPFTGFADDVAAVADAIDRAGADGSPVVAVAHSLGGIHLSEAAGPGVCHRPPAQLVYVAAVMCDADQAPEQDAFNIADVLRFNGDTVHADPVGAASRFFGRCRSGDVAAAVQRLRTMPIGSLIPPALKAPAWRQIPSTYVICTQDQVITAETQRRMAVNAAATLEIDADHSPFLSRTERLADLVSQVCRLPATPFADGVTAARPSDV